MWDFNTSIKDIPISNGIQRERKNNSPRNQKKRNGVNSEKELKRKGRGKKRKS